MDSKKIENMKIAGEMLSEVIEQLLATVKPGISEIELDKLADELITQKGGKPGFQLVSGYKNALCVSTNNVVVHGIPTDRKLKEGDVVGIDCGVYYGGYHTDMAETVKISNIKNQRSNRKNEIDKFLETGKRALFEAINQARAGNRVGHISKTIQDIVEGAGYSVVRSLVGHGVGRRLHESPEVPGYLAKKIEETPLLKSGQTLAIEVIYNMGGADVVYEGDDDWTIVTKDGSLSALFERTVLITDNKADPLTFLEEDKKSRYSFVAK